MHCPKCGTNNPSQNKFCAECGAAFLGASEVSTSLAVSSAPLSVPDPEVPEGERKIVTALFADLKGSTQLMEDLDPEVAHAIVAPALRIMADAVQRYEGYVARSTGDGIFALFGAPAAYEDHPQRALYAALEMQRELRAEGQRRAATGMQSLEARVGVHTGEVVAYSVETGGKVEYRLVGHTANLAARLEALAPVGSIAVSEHTRQLCEGYFELRALGPMTVKGLSAPINVYEVLGLGALRTHFQLSARRGLTKFIGRQRELEQMQRALEQAIGGHGQVVAVMAEAGTGKSRLFHEFKATIPATCKVLEAYSVSHGKASAWLPVLELLRNYFGIEDTDDAASRRVKIRAALTALDPALQDTLPYLFGLLGIFEGPDPIAQMDPQIKRQRTLDAIKCTMLSESLEQPVVMIFEDLHWIDAQTQALLDLLANSVASARILLLVNYRPEYHHEWTNQSYYSQLRLDPLGVADGAAMLAALLGEAVELNPLKRLITERTGGNPFFIEEIVQALFDEGALTRNGAIRVTRSLSQLRLPPTVQGMLAARIDRQPAEHKQLLQTLAVVGRESSLGLLRQLASHPDNQLEQMLAQLRAGEFIYEQPAATDVEYVFKHALTQEVAYNSLLIERRKQLHERAGVALESIFAAQLDDHLTQLAHHYSHSDNIEKAVEYLGRAGQQAITRSAYSDAIGIFNSAIDLLQKLPNGLERARREVGFQLALGSAFFAVKGWAAREAGDAQNRARELCEQLGDPPELFRALLGLWAVYFIRGEFKTTHELARRVLRRAESSNDSTSLMFGHSAVGLTLFNEGELVLAREQLNLAIAPYDRELDRPTAMMGLNDAGVPSLTHAAITLWHLGYPDQALARANQAVTLARDISHSFSMAMAENWLCRVHLVRGEPGAAQHVAEQLMGLCGKQGFTYYSAMANVLLGAARFEQNRTLEAIAQMQEGLAAQGALGAHIGRPYWLSVLARAYGESGRVDEGVRLLNEALTTAQEQDALHYLAEIYRLRSELLLKLDASNRAEAQANLECGIEIARKQSARSLELRATMSLARLLITQGRRDEARAMLAEIYKWFTEGFDTVDLKDAKALLDKLSNLP